MKIAKVRRRRGAIVVLFAMLLVVFLAVFAFAIDLGLVCSFRGDLQRAADSGALAGAGKLIDGVPVATATARDFVRLNPSGGRTLTDGEISVDVGRWDRNSRAFLDGQTPFDAVRVTTRQDNTPLFFGRLFRRTPLNLQTAAVATSQPRDIMLVLDYSGSMNDDHKIESLKDAVTMFIAYLQQAGTRDRVGLTIYSTNGQLAQTLTFDLAAVERSVRSRLAGGWTNIGEGLQLGFNDLRTNGRAGANKMMVLMTDGIANRPLNRDPFQYVRDEAQLCAAAKIPVVSISFGSDADQTIMREVADITGSVHFHVAGSVAGQEQQIKDVFLKVAANRPLQLVQ